MRSTCFTLPILGLVLALSVGCSSSTTHGTVIGTVTLDGQPLQEGTVRFVPVDGDSQTASAAIDSGSFVATVPVGSYRVEFSAPKTVGKKKMYESPDSPEVDVVVELLPDRYNVNSILTLNVEAGRVEHLQNLSSE